jgi:hypothetical protein
VGNNPVGKVDPQGLAWHSAGFIGPMQPGDFYFDNPDASFVGGPYIYLPGLQSFWDKYIDPPSPPGFLGGSIPFGPPRTKLGGRITEPRLPSRTICEEQGVKITQYYRSGDHAPAHLHVEGEGPSTKVGQAGHPIQGSPELSATQKEVIAGNRSAIRKAIDQIQRWFRFENTNE